MFVLSKYFDSTWNANPVSYVDVVSSLFILCSKGFGLKPFCEEGMLQSLNLDERTNCQKKKSERKLEKTLQSMAINILK